MLPCVAACCVLLALTPGCQSAVDTVTGTRNADVGRSMNQPTGTLTRKELAQKLRRLALAYLGEVPQICEEIALSDAELDQRLTALQIRANSSDSIINIAADPDPQVALLNMVTVLTLQRMLAEDKAVEFFGERGQLYVDSTRRMEEQGWKLAAQVLDEDEQAQLKELITQYRKDHPEDNYVWWTRFSEFSGYTEQFSIASVGQGIVDVFVPVGGAVQGLDTTNDVAERAAWLAARQALIIQWRVELMYLQTMAAPETRRLLDDVERVSATVEKLPGQIAAEREAILEAVDEQQSSLRETIGETNKTIDNARSALADVQDTIEQGTASLDQAKRVLPEAEATLAQLEQTSDSLNQTLQTFGAIAKEFDSPEDQKDPSALSSRPFDITEYTAALQEAGATLQELNTVLASVDRTAEPTRLDATLDTLEGRFNALIWQAGFAFCAAGLIIVLAAKLIPGRRKGAAA